MNDDVDSIDRRHVHVGLSLRMYVSMSVYAHLYEFSSIELVHVLYAACVVLVYYCAYVSFRIKPQCSLFKALILSVAIGSG